MPRVRAAGAVRGPSVPRARPSAPWAASLLQRREVGSKLEAEVSAARYFVLPARYETLAWCELRELGERPPSD